MMFTNDEKAELFRSYRYRKSCPYSEFEEDLNLIGMVEADIRRIVNRRANQSARRLANEIITFMNGFSWPTGKEIMLAKIDKDMHVYLVAAFDILRTDMGNVHFEEHFLNFVRKEHEELC